MIAYLETGFLASLGAGYRHVDHERFGWGELFDVRKVLCTSRSDVDPRVHTANNGVDDFGSALTTPPFVVGHRTCSYVSFLTFNREISSQMGL